MKKKLAIITSFFLIQSGNALACPTCVSSDPKDKYYIYVVSIFVLLIYIPMFYMFKTFIKHKNVNNSSK